MGRRNHDKAQTAIIEFVDNPLIDHEKEQEEKIIREENIHSFWEWEHKLLVQEIEFTLDRLKEFKEKEDSAVQEMIRELKRQYPDFEYEIEDVRQHVTVTLSEEKNMLINAYKRAIKEEQIHVNQKESKKYANIFKKFAYPLEDFNPT